MKKRNRRILSLTVAIMMLLVTVLSSSAAGITLTPIVQTPAALTRILSAHPELSIASSQPLYSPTNEITAYYYTFSPTGYAIASVQGEVVEWSPTATREIPANQTVYYAGPLSYFTKSGASYVDVYSGEAYSVSAVAAQYAEYEVTAQAYAVPTDVAPAGVVLPGIDTTIEDRTPYTPTPYRHQSIECGCGYNAICGSVATAILLKYYNDYICPGIVPSTVPNPSNSAAFIHFIVGFVQTDGPYEGTTYEDVQAGINQFITAYHSGTSYADYAAYSDTEFTYQEYIAHIGNDTPVTLGLADAPTYGYHRVVGYGYSETFQGGISGGRYCITCDGWGDSEIFIGFDYVSNTVYIS